MEGSVKLHAPAALPVEKGPSAHIESEDGYDQNYSAKSLSNC
jgi:hypothetical protein